MLLWNDVIQNEFLVLCIFLYFSVMSFLYSVIIICGFVVFKKKIYLNFTKIVYVAFSNMVNLSEKKPYRITKRLLNPTWR